MILTAGYFASKSATSLSMFGTQVQNVSSVGVFIALSMSAWPTGSAEVPPLVSSPPPQADSAVASVRAPVAARKPRRFRWAEEGAVKNLDMVDSAGVPRGSARWAAAC